VSGKKDSSAVGVLPEFLRKKKKKATLKPSRKRNRKNALFTRTTAKVHVTRDIVKHVFRAETTRQESKSTKELVVKKNRISNKVVVTISSVIFCRLQLVENKKETFFSLVITGIFPTKKIGDDACEAARLILVNEIQVAAVRADRTKVLVEKRAEEKKFAAKKRAPKKFQVKDFPVLMVLNSAESLKAESIRVTRAEADSQRKQRMDGKAKQMRTSEGMPKQSFPEPDVLFRDILQKDVSMRAQLEKKSCNEVVTVKKMEKKKQIEVVMVKEKNIVNGVIVGSEKPSNPESVTRIAKLEEQVNQMSEIIKRMMEQRI